VKKGGFIAVLALILAAISLLPAQTKKSLKDLPPEHRKWLEEDVVYIISPKEKEVFLQLETNRDRSLFIQAFWKQRDPTPETEENEFRTEHYRRIQYANQWFGKDSPGPGWRSDMGRVYITLGEPKSIEKFENLIEIKPTIIWFYSEMAEYGLPGSFNIVFYKRETTGEYRLYSPINDGPQSLLIHYMGDMTNHLQAAEELMGFEPAVGAVSLSLIPGEAQFLTAPSLASEVLIRQHIPSSSYERFKDDYAEKLLRYKDIIDVDYSANYIASEALVSVYRGPSGLTFVHYLIEPSRLTFEETQREYGADLEVNGIVSDDQGRTVYQFDRTIPIRMGEEQFNKIKANPFSLQDLFPLVPGRYSVSILWKNRVTKAFTSLEADILVPDPDAFWMSPPVLAYKVDRESRFRGSNKSFLFGDIQFVPSSRLAFLPGETMSLFFQLVNVPGDLRDGGSVKITILKEGLEVLSRSRDFRDAAARTDFFEEFPLAGFSPARYEVRVAVLNADSSERLSSRSFFDVSPVAYLPRPWVISLPLPASDSPLIANILGGQYLQKNDLVRARPLLETAYARDPGSVTFALDYCRVLFQAKDYAGIKRVALPYLGDDRKYDFLQIMGDVSRELGEYAEAIDYYKDYLAHFGTNILVLNGIGHCHLRLGSVPDALFAFEKSLELNPNQEDLKVLVKSLKEKK
jgi:GWxTD domain-containing protein